MHISVAYCAIRCVVGLAIYFPTVSGQNNLGRSVKLP